MQEEPHVCARLRRQSADAGATVIEFALILPLFVGIFLGCVTGGLALFSRLQAATAAEEGARAIYVGGTAAEALSAVTAALDSPNPATTHAVALTVDGAAVASDWRCTDVGNSGKTVTVQVDRLNANIQWLVASTPVTIRGRGVTRCA